MRLKDKICLVTGAASGFGEGIAQKFAAEGAKIAIVDMNAEGAKRVAGEIGNGAIAVTCDVSKAEDVEAAVARVTEEFGRIDVIVNNAGWSNKNAPLMETDEATMRKLYDVNVMSIFHMTKSIVPRWREGDGGVMINVTSTAGIRPRPGLTWYNSSKGAANIMTKSLAVELAPDNIRVCALAPVMGVTALLENFMGLPDTPENRAKFIASVPMGRLSEPRDVANAAAFLASDEAEFLTGTVMEVDGGRCV
ncbi:MULTISPECIES: SDR family oxidoreductase [unclassified Roseivivax]|uniref:SDR family oxidoreductase n=1 Tax=Roseivivax sp. GX 12232 TaxID=2900547 RepID=UPI001E356877|nr:SDR family oxidoreductase [Roseivivax sp. GX 12232]MCE0506560.1 SDR family oxidoreductase [Roseivivax sp. GX 12232]